MDIVNLYFNFVSISAALGVFVIGTIVYIGDRRNVVGKFWFFSCLSAAAWSAFFFLVINSSTKESAIIWRICLDTAAISVTYFWFRFVLMFLNIDSKKIIYGTFSATVLLLALNVSPWFVNDLVPKYIFNYYVSAGWGYYIFALYFVVISTTGLFFLARAERIESGERAAQIKSIFRGSIIGLIGAGSSFLLAFGLPVPPFLFILFAAFPLIIAQGIVKHKLFNLRVIATQLFTMGIWVFLGVRFLLSATQTDLILNGVLLVAVIIFGILLIQSVYREVEQREALAVANAGQKNLIHIMNHQIKGFLGKDRNIFAELMTDDYGHVPETPRPLIF